MITISSKGNFNRTESFLKRASQFNIRRTLNEFGESGVRALASATPSESGETARSWFYEVSVKRDVSSITWMNSHIVDGVPIVILLQYGHGTGTGGYVQGRDFINPAIQPIFDQIASDVWKAVTSA